MYFIVHAALLINSYLV